MPKMLNISFRLLSEEQIDENILKNLKRKFFLPKYLFKVLEGKKFDYPGQILKDHSLIKTINPLDLTKLIVPPFYELGKYSLHYDIKEEEQHLDAESAISIYIFNISADKRRVALSTPNGELVSVNIDHEGSIDPTTLKFGGYWFWEWPKIPNSIKLAIFRTILLPNKKGLNLLGNSSSKYYPGLPDKMIPIKNIAQLGMFFISSNVYRNLTGEVASGNGGITPPDDIYQPGEGIPHDEYPESNECTASPDYPFSECCIAHDFCYVENVYGCDECARLKCDLDFLDCMLEKAGNNPLFIEMAYVYFIAVRAAGGVSGFNYCSSAPSGTGGFSLGSFTSVGLAVAVGVAAGVTVGGLIGGPLGVAGGIAAGTAVAGAVGAIFGKVFCELCGEMVEWIEHCEADRIIREERCEKLKKKCKKKKKWWKKLWCKIKYFWHCVIVDLIKKGACWLLKEVVYPVVC